MIIFFYKKEGENMHKKITRIISILVIILFIYSLTNNVFAQVEDTQGLDVNGGSQRKLIRSNYNSRR